MNNDFLLFFLWRPLPLYVEYSSCIRTAVYEYHSTTSGTNTAACIHSPWAIYVPHVRSLWHRSHFEHASLETVRAMQMSGALTIS